jgi:hypothetical protein
VDDVELGVAEGVSVSVPTEGCAVEDAIVVGAGVSASGGLGVSVGMELWSRLSGNWLLPGFAHATIRTATTSIARLMPIAPANLW